MTYPEFLQKLRETPRDWTGHRLRRGGINDERYCCPIVAVCGGYLGAPMAAAKSAGIPAELAYKIIEAADGYSSADSKIRRDLLDACGIL